MIDFRCCYFLRCFDNTFKLSYVKGPRWISQEISPPPKRASNLHEKETRKILHSYIYWVDAKVSADFFSFLCFKFLLKQNTINQQRIYHCYL